MGEKVLLLVLVILLLAFSFCFGARVRDAIIHHENETRRFTKRSVPLGRVEVEPLGNKDEWKRFACEAWGDGWGVRE